MFTFQKRGTLWFPPRKREDCEKNLGRSASTEVVKVGAIFRRPNKMPPKPRYFDEEKDLLMKIDFRDEWSEKVERRPKWSSVDLIGVSYHGLF